MQEPIGIFRAFAIRTLGSLRFTEEQKPGRSPSLVELPDLARLRTSGCAAVRPLPTNARYCIPRLVRCTPKSAGRYSIASATRDALGYMDDIESAKYGKAGNVWVSPGKRAAAC